MVNEIILYYDARSKKPQIYMNMLPIPNGFRDTVIWIQTAKLLIRKRYYDITSRSSHGRDIGPMLQKHLGTEYKVTSIFKPNVPLENVVEGLANLGKDLTKKDHIVIVGGPGNSLEKNYHYSIEKDLNFIARRTDHTNVRFVNLLRMYDKP